MKFAVTGVSSGLGKALHERFGGLGLSMSPLRRKESLRAAERAEVDVFVHCAANRSREADADSFPDYFRDNVGLAETLAALPGKRFIYISSVDVYPAGGPAHAEDEKIPLESPPSLSGMCKLLSEAAIRRERPDALILRPAAMLGVHARNNSLTRIADDRAGEAKLSGDSSFNYILHQDVGDFIELAVSQNLGGIFNLASSGNVTLREIADRLGKSVSFGKRRYDAGPIDNSKASALIPAFGRTSMETVERFLRSR